MRKRILTISATITLVSLLVAALVVSMTASAPSTVAAARVQAASPQHAPPPAPPYTHHAVATVQLSNDVCAKLKQANPAKANDPQLCVATHESWSTDIYQLQGNTPYSVIGDGGGCPNGYRQFDDAYFDVLSFSIEQTSNFHWLGDCGLPSIVGHICVIHWIAGIVQGQDCTPQQTDATHEVAWQDVFFLPWGTPFTAEIWQARVCDISASCYQTDDTGHVGP